MVHQIVSAYEQEFDFPYKIEAPSKTYMVAAIPRTGSTHFCLSLWRTGCLGAPLEYINLKNRDHTIDRLGGGDLVKYWKALLHVRTSKNGVFGFKSFVPNFKDIAVKSEELLALIAPAHVVYITRRDKIAQAASYARAVQTQAWFAGVKEQTAPRYDPALLKQAELWIAQQEDSWEKIFQLKEVDPIRVYYEDFLARPDETMAVVAGAMGVTLDPDARIQAPEIERQADEMSADWIQLYQHERSVQSVPAG